MDNDVFDAAAPPDGLDCGNPYSARASAAVLRGQGPGTAPLQDAVRAVLAKHPAGLHLTRLAGYVGAHTSNVSRALAALAEKGVVARSEKKRWRLA